MSSIRGTIRSRLVYRPIRHADHKNGGRKSFAGTEYRDLLIAAHQQLGGPIVLVWDNLNVHKDRRMRAFIDAHDWISACHLPPYAPALNPVEGIWSMLRRTSQANTALTDPDHLMHQLRRGLRRIQNRGDIIDGCLTGTGLTLTTPRLQGQWRPWLPTQSSHPHTMARGPGTVRRIMLQGRGSGGRRGRSGRS
ncbi:transposase [Streptomyces sp. NPDC058623]|uniref:transposase n=1 Tax=Streptomyces sp. NPDC058623 TaxID=3346563 RepID=UPI003660E22E